MTSPKLEAAKELLRWASLYTGSFIITWIITETLKQITSVPDAINVRLWVFSYSIPVRNMLAVTLTLVGRYVDKFMHEQSKIDVLKSKDKTADPSGLLPF